MERVARTTTMATDSRMRRMARLIFSDGVLPGVVRLGLSLVYTTALCAATIRAVHADAAIGAIALVALFTGIFGYVVGWRELAVVAFAPDRALWHAEGGLGWTRRLPLTALRLFLAWVLLTVLTSGLVPHVGMVVLLPLAASAAQCWCDRRRSARGPRLGNGRGWRSVSGP